MGSYKGLKEVRRIVEDCMANIHPIYHIKVCVLGGVPSPTILLKLHLGREVLTRESLKELMIKRVCALGVYLSSSVLSFESQDISWE